jgi:hypothetical protein
MENWFDQLFMFYLEQRGWLYLVTIPSLVFIVTLIDNQRNDRGGIGWLVGMFISILAFVPAAIYDIGPQETIDALVNVRIPMFYAGVLGAIVPIMLLLGYFLSTRNVPQSEQVQQVGAVQAPLGGGGNPPFAMDNGSADQPTMLDSVPTVGASGPPPVGFGPPPGAFPPPASGGAPAGFSGAPMPPLGLGDGPTMLEASHAPMQGRSQKPHINAWLIDLSNDSVRYQLFEGETVIGRGTQFDIALTDSAVSRPHAVIEQKGRSFMLRDLGSRSGTFVNGYPIDGEGQIMQNTKIRIGNHEYRFISE